MTRIQVFTLAKLLGIFTTFVIAIACVCPLALAQRTLTTQQQSSRRITLTWKNQELATAIQRLAEVGDTYIWLDRRVDKQRKIDLQINDASLQVALEALAAQEALGILQLEGLIYVGPDQAALELPVLLRQARNSLKQLPTVARRAWLREAEVKWPELSEPRDLISSWLKEFRIELIGIEEFPHDLYPACELPKMTLLDRVVLMLAEFDLTCSLKDDGRFLTITKIQRPLTTTTKRRTQKRPSTRQQSESAQRVYSLRIQNQPLGAVLDQFAQQLQLEIVWADDLQRQVNTLRQRRVSCDVTNVALVELLRVLLSQTELQFELTDRRLTLSQK